MAIISFWGNSKKETGQTLTMVSISSVMAIEHNYKILVIGTDFRDDTMEECYWPRKAGNVSIQSILGLEEKDNVGTMSGIEGLARVVQSGRTGNDIVGSYAKPVFKDKRLDVLVPPETTSLEKYNVLCQNYPDVIKMANSDYNLVFVDVSDEMPIDIQKQILQSSDIIAIGINQGANDVERFMELRKKDPMFSGKNVMIFIGKYDGYSRYNIKNLERYLKGKNMVLGVSYNTLFYESAAEGKVIDYFFKMRNITGSDDRNAIFMEQNRYACENIIYKLKELQIR